MTFLEQLCKFELFYLKTFVKIQGFWTWTAENGCFKSTALRTLITRMNIYSKDKKDKDYITIS